MIQEVFVEDVWEDSEVARQRRDARYAVLQAAGLECHREDLYTVDLRRVFVVTAMPLEEISASQFRQIEPVRSRQYFSNKTKGERSTESPRLRSNRPNRVIRGYEDRSLG